MGVLGGGGSWGGGGIMANIIEHGLLYILEIQIENEKSNNYEIISTS